MSRLLSLPPKLLDHTFPRADYELRDVAVALADITERAQKGEILIFVTDTFRLIVEEFNWEGESSAPQRGIYNLLSLLFLSGQRFMVNADCAADSGPSILHPLPEGHEDGHLSGLWREEMGAALRWHDRHVTRGEFYMGIACAQNFAGGALGGYKEGEIGRKFPIVGPESLTESRSPIHKAVIYVLPVGECVPSVSFDQAYRNIGLLGAIDIKAPRKGSHYRVSFPGARSWVLDKNHPVIPESYLRELKGITGYDYPVICYVLTKSEFPPKRLFFEASDQN